MQLFQSNRHEEPSPCPYLPGRVKRYEFFLANRLSGAELSNLLAEGWRKFGFYFFRPDCPDCRQCIPLRIPVADFQPSRSQRRILRRDRELKVEFGPLRMDERIYQIYREHAGQRFGEQTDPEEFLYNFYLSSCPVLQTEIYLDRTLIGVGYLDQGEDCLNSVYFCFDPAYARYRLGTLSILAEISKARAIGLSYYYLGFYVPGCSRMAYKDHFRPRELFDWPSRRWLRTEAPPGRSFAEDPVSGA